MDETDRRIIAGLEDGLPDSPTPWEDAARALGIAPGDLLARLEEMRRSGVLRAVRAVLDQRKLGLDANVLVAWAVPEERADEVGELFLLRREVSHCVLREPADDWPYNLYTMIHARSAAEADSAVRELARSSGVAGHVALATLRELKKTPPRYS
jgi:DNA-binding Lrp family transcriptional regulator